MAEKNHLKNPIVIVAAVIFLLSGITLTLAYWPDVVSLFRGVIGIILALIGMFILYLSRI